MKGNVVILQSFRPFYKMYFKERGHREVGDNYFSGQKGGIKREP